MSSLGCCHDGNVGPKRCRSGPRTQPHARTSVDRSLGIAGKVVVGVVRSTETLQVARVDEGVVHLEAVAQRHAHGHLWQNLEEEGMWVIGCGALAKAARRWGKAKWPWRTAATMSFRTLETVSPKTFPRISLRGFSIRLTMSWAFQLGWNVKGSD